MRADRPLGYIARFTVVISIACALGCHQAVSVPETNDGSTENVENLGNPEPITTTGGDARNSDTVTAVTNITTTEILWDEWGVPHIFATDPESLLFAHGWSQTKSHGNLLLRLLGESRGRAAEYWGEEHLEDDRWIHTMGIPERAAAWYEAQAPRTRSWLDAFARGINTYAGEHPDEISGDVAVVLPVSGIDILAHRQRSIHFTFVTSRGAVNRARRRWEGRGSNAWAVGPKRSASGRALLVANPHLRWSGLYTWHEAQLTSPEVNIYGAGLLGGPILGIAFNDHLGWTHTVNTHDGADLYQLTLADGGYRFDDRVRPFGIKEKTLKVRSPDGSIRDERLIIRTSVHGPVVAERDGAQLALRVVGLHAPRALEQYWEMSTATNLEEFEAALRKMQVPMFTVMYADRDGRILHLFGGETPVRSSGDWAYWSGVVPGDTSATLWTTVHAYDELPRVVDPESGWLQNANDPPWTTTFPPALDADDFPPYMAPRFMSFRAQRSARMLAEDEQITFEELVDYKHSSRMELADRVLDDLAVAVESHGSDLTKRAYGVLESWDRAADAESRGSVLFARFVEELSRTGGSGGLAEGWSEERPRRTPDGLADSKAAAVALEAAARVVMREHGTLDVPWGEVYRLRQGDRDFPANGGPGQLGIFRVVGYRKDADGRFRAGGGDSYVACVEFSDPVRARVLLTTGNSTQPGSPHNGDQLELFSRKELRPVWRRREEIEQHLEAREDLGRYTNRAR